MNYRKFEPLLNFSLGVSWAISIFGTIFVFFYSLSTSSFIFSLIVAFIFFSVASLVTIFLESVELQLNSRRELVKQNQLLDRISEKLEKLDQKDIGDELKKERLGEDS